VHVTPADVEPMDHRKEGKDYVIGVSEDIVKRVEETAKQQPVAVLAE